MLLLRVSKVPSIAGNFNADRTWLQVILTSQQLAIGKVVSPKGSQAM